MKLDAMNTIKTNTIFKCYVEVPAFLVERVEAQGILQGESDKQYVQVRLQNCSITVFSPAEFAENSIYSITVNRKQVGEKVYNHVTFSSYDWQNQADGFSNTPPILPPGIAASVIQSFSDEACDFFLAPELGAEPTSEPVEAKVVELREKFWRKAKEIAPDGNYQYNNYHVFLTPAPQDSEHAAGVYAIIYDETNQTFTVQPTAEPVSTTPEELSGWIRDITGWCGNVERILS